MATVDQSTQTNPENLELAEDATQEGVNLERKAPGYGYAWKIKLHAGSYPGMDELLADLKRIDRRMENDYGDRNLVKPTSRKA